MKFDGDFVRGRFQLMTRDGSNRMFVVKRGYFDEVFDHLIYCSRGEAEKIEVRFGAEFLDTEVYRNKKTGRLYYIRYIGKD